MISLAKGAGAQWVAEEGFESAVARADDAATAPLVLGTSRDVSRPAALMVLTLPGPGKPPAISRVRLSRSDGTAARKLSL